MNYEAIFTSELLAELFPKDRADAFFDALFGGAEEGAYDISLRFVGSTEATLEMAFALTQRPGKCLACNLTYGLPQVFSRHPVINVKGIVEGAGKAVGKDVADFSLGATQEQNRELHVIPLTIRFA